MSAMPHDEAILPRSGVAGSVPWVVAVMTCLAMLGLALALALTPTAAALSGEIAGRATVQIIEPDRPTRVESVQAVRAALADAPYVREVRIVPEAELRGMAEQWLGEGAQDGELPLPALIDVDLTGDSAAGLRQLAAAVERVAPQARVIRHADWLGPVSGLIASIGWIAALVAVLLVAAAAATAVLAARAIIAAQTPTIDILHLVGATDVQIARLVQRRIARATAIGAIMGGIVALIVALLVATQARAAIGAMARGQPLWHYLWVLAVPPLVIALAALAARITVLRTLGGRP